VNHVNVTLFCIDGMFSLRDQRTCAHVTVDTVHVTLCLEILLCHTVE